MCRLRAEGSEIEMNLNDLSDKNLHEIERLAKELLDVMRKAKLNDEPLADVLKQLENQAGDLRRKRFDAANPEYRGY